jgi:hypothetical protein
MAKLEWFILKNYEPPKERCSKIHPEDDWEHAPRWCINEKGHPEGEHEWYREIEYWGGDIWIWCPQCRTWWDDNTEHIGRYGQRINYRVFYGEDLPE